MRMRERERILISAKIVDGKVGRVWSEVQHSDVSRRVSAHRLKCVLVSRRGT